MIVSKESDGGKMTLEVLKALNPDLEIFDIDDAVFENYGRRITGIDVSELIRCGKQIGFPETGSVYEASNELFEQLPVTVELQDECFGELPIQIGYCYGHNNLLNGLEWHTSSEINVAVTDMVLLLAERKQLSNGTIDSSLVKAFLLKEGDVVEVYATSMHFCPCRWLMKDLDVWLFCPKERILHWRNHPGIHCYSEKTNG